MSKELKRFEQWWDAEDDIPNNGPYTPDTPIQFAWAGWQAALAEQPAQQEPVVWRPSESDYEQWCDRHDTQLDRDAFEDAASLYMEYAHNIKEQS